MAALLASMGLGDSHVTVVCGALCNEWPVTVFLARHPAETVSFFWLRGDLIHNRASLRATTHHV